VTQLLFTPDGSRLLSCGTDGKVVLYSTVLQKGAASTSHKSGTASAATAAYTPIKVLPDGSDAVNNMAVVSAGVCAAVSPAGDLLAVSQMIRAAPTSSSSSSTISGSGSGSRSVASVLLLTAASLEVTLRVETGSEDIRQ
jgi:hypothetical protein